MPLKRARGTHSLHLPGRPSSTFYLGNRSLEGKKLFVKVLFFCLLDISSFFFFSLFPFSFRWSTWTIQTLVPCRSSLKKGSACCSLDVRVNKVKIHLIDNLDVSTSNILTDLYLGRVVYEHLTQLLHLWADLSPQNWIIWKQS